MPRPRKTKAIEDAARSLPDLTPKQFAFVQGLLAGMTASDAYRAAYDAQSMSTEAIWVAASRLKAETKVSLWLDTVRSQQLADTAITKESHTRELLRLAKAAEKSGNYGAAGKCVELTGRVNGLYVDRIETDTGKAEVLQALAAIKRLDPALASTLEDKLGLSEGPQGDRSVAQSKLTH